MKDLPLMIPLAIRPWLLAAFTVLFCAVGRQMKLASASLNPKPLELEFPWTQAGADEILTRWDAAAKRAARRNLYLDFVFIVSYVGFLNVACAMASHALAAASWRGAGLGTWMMWAVLVAGLLDVIENIGQLAMIAGQRGPVWPLLTSVCASLKFLLAGVALLYAVCGLGAFILHLLRPRQ